MPLSKPTQRRCSSIPFYSGALIFSSSPLLYLSTPFHCFTYLLRSSANLISSVADLRFPVPLPYKSGLHFSIAFLNLSSRHCSIANHFFAIAMLYLPWQFLTPLRLCTSILGSSLPLLFRTLPLLIRTSLYRGQSRLIRFSAQQHICCAVRFYSIAFLFLSIAPHFSYTQFRCG